MECLGNTDHNTDHADGGNGDSSDNGMDGVVESAAIGGLGLEASISDSRRMAYIELVTSIPRVCSPTICGTTYYSTPKRSLHLDQTFNWSIEQIAILNPLEFSNYEDLIAFKQIDKQLESNSDIDKENDEFFSQKLIIPSPETAKCYQTTDKWRLNGESCSPFFAMNRTPKHSSFTDMNCDSVIDSVGTPLQSKVKPKKKLFVDEQYLSETCSASQSMDSTFGETECNHKDMDLYCIEITEQPKAYSDPVFLDDERVLKNLMCTQERYTISLSYFKCVQTELKPYMRKVVAMWMCEVCEEEGCQEEVFPLSMNILDRFLAIVEIRKSQLQLLGSVCLFLASKLRQTHPLSAEKLILYTDKSITLDELMGWELLVLNRLKWDLAAITPNDFLNILLRRLHKWPKGSEVQTLIKKHSQTFISLCASEFKFSMFPPSMVAAASIITAIEGLTRIKTNKLWHYTRPMISQLHQITGIKLDDLRECQLQIERIMANSQLPELQTAFVT